MRGGTKMKRIKQLLWLQLVSFLIIIPGSSTHAQIRPDDPYEQETVLVGRISHVEGQLLRYVPDEKEWVATVKDAPFYTEDLLYLDEKGKAEFILPNNTWVRIDGDTQIQLNVLKDDVTEIDVAFGMVRFDNKGSYAVIKATTPFGYVMAPEETSFDLYVGDDRLEVVALKGKLDFFHGTSETRCEVIPGSAAIVADRRQVTVGKVDVDIDWDRWNQDRENLWATRSRTAGESVKYLPSRLHYEAYALEKHGRWERVYYDGGYSYFWRPVYVSVGWTPFTVGRWTVCYGENVWIPYEPFGYVTHHYGNWVYARGSWYWAPPVARVSVRIGSPLLQIGFAWYPGRVAWIHSGGYVGWVPLAPYEPYYCYRRWGPRAVVVKNVNMATVNINRYKYYKHAVIINQGKLYTADNYKKVRIRHKNHATVVNNYRVAPVVNNTVVKNYKKVSRRHDFRNVDVKRKRNRPTIKTVRERQLSSRKDIRSKSQTRRQDIADLRYDRPIKGANDSLPKTKISRSKDRLSVTNQLNRRVMEAKPHEKEQKKRVILRTEDRMQTTKEIRKSSKRMPVEPVRRKKVRAEDNRYNIKREQKVHREAFPQPMGQQEVQAEYVKKTGKGKRKVQKEVAYGASEQAKLAGQVEEFRGRKGLQKTRQNPQFLQPEPGQGKTHRAFGSHKR
jgi:hypothetical protein